MRPRRSLAEELSGTFVGVAARTASKRPDQAWLYEGRAESWKRLLTASEQGKPIAWVYVPVMHDPNLFESLEREYGAVAVMDMMANTSTLPSKTCHHRGRFTGVWRTSWPTCP